jgi:DNA-binding transcriptional LysR family regulator
VRLFTRTTRSVRLTSEGELYRAQCQQALEQIAEAERAITGRQTVPKGLLRVSVGTVYGHHRLVPLLPGFMDAFAGVEVELNVSNRNIDFVEDGYDLAIRLGEPHDSRLVARRLEDAGVGVFASPHYLKRRGCPKSIDDLRQHDLIQFVVPSTGRPMSWLLRGADGAEIDFSFRSRQRVHEDVLVGVIWAAAGGGLFQIYHFVAQPLVDAGRLVEVMRSAGGRSRPFYVLYPPNWHLSARVRAFVDHLTRAVGATPPATTAQPAAAARPAPSREWARWGAYLARNFSSAPFGGVKACPSEDVRGLRSRRTRPACRRRGAGPPPWLACRA